MLKLIERTYLALAALACGVCAWPVAMVLWRVLGL